MAAAVIQSNEGTKHSPFFETGPNAQANDLAILHLRRDQLVPVVINPSEEAHDGYAEGVVTNTRFGSFPHRTLLDREWGSQIVASKVDTGSRGRPGSKRKRGDGAGHTGITTTTQDKNADNDGETPGSGSGAATPTHAVIDASSGFVHLLPPTPETWTLGLPHRTQVVYTPDYSYALQRMRVSAGQTLIEAGAGSGSFTHAAARAVYSGTSTQESSLPHGRVYSYEYHETRVNGLRAELDAHGLSDVVTVTNRDVCQDGFALGTSPHSSPRANAVFLDMPAPWTALKHLTRQPSSTGAPSPLHPNTAVHLCTFSPCIEQVQATVIEMRRLGWTEIETVEIQHRRIDVKRERVGLHDAGARGVFASAASVTEAVHKLRDIEERHKAWQETQAAEEQENAAGKPPMKKSKTRTPAAERKSTEHDKTSTGDRKKYLEGQIVHRTEPDIKSHTSYLVFAVLPREWTDADEARCLEIWGTGPVVTEEVSRGLDRAGKKEARRKVHAANLEKKKS